MCQHNLDFSMSRFLSLSLSLFSIMLVIMSVTLYHSLPRCTQAGNVKN